MQKDFRVLHQNNTRNPPSAVNIGLKQGKNIDAPHAGSHLVKGPLHIPLPVMDHTPDTAHIRHICRHIIINILTLSAVFMKIFVDAFGETVKVSLIEFVFKKPGGFQNIQFFRRFLFNFSDAVKTPPTVLSRIKDAAVIPEPSRPFVLLVQKNVLLNVLKVTHAVNIIKLRNDLRNIIIVFFYTVTAAFLPAAVHCQRKR